MTVTAATQGEPYAMHDKDNRYSHTLPDDFNQLCDNPKAFFRGDMMIGALDFFGSA